MKVTVDVLLKDQGGLSYCLMCSLNSFNYATNPRNMKWQERVINPEIPESIQMMGHQYHINWAEGLHVVRE